MASSLLMDPLSFVSLPVPVPCWTATTATLMEPSPWMSLALGRSPWNFGINSRCIAELEINYIYSGTKLKICFRMTLPSAFLASTLVDLGRYCIKIFFLQKILVLNHSNISVTAKVALWQGAARRSNGNVFF